MRVRMKVTISGTRDGQSWPERGGFVDLPDSEAEQLIASGLAASPDDSEDPEAEDREEHATVPGAPEKAAGRKPAPKPTTQK